MPVVVELLVLEQQEFEFELELELEQPVLEEQLELVVAE